MAGMLSDMFGGNTEGSNHVVPASSLEGDSAGEATNVQEGGDAAAVQEDEGAIGTFSAIADGGEVGGDFGLTPGLNEAQPGVDDYDF